MEAKARTILEVIGKQNTQFNIPVYQRSYTWTEKDQVEKLWKDLIFFKNEACRINDQEFFLGTLILKLKGGIDKIVTLVDGQQRITTVLLLIAALKLCWERKEIDESEKSAYYSMCEHIQCKDGKIKLKRINDSNILKLILDNNSSLLDDKQMNSNYYKTFNFFKTRIDYELKHDKSFIVDFYRNVLDRIKIASIELSEFEDEYTIFESINSKGKPLSPIDLIKNYVVMNLEELNDSQEVLNLYENKFLSGFSKYEKPDESIIDFYRQMIALKTGKLFSKKGNQLFYSYKSFFETNNGNYNTKEKIKESILELINDKLIWDYIHNEKFELYLYPLIDHNKLNFYTIIHTIIKFNSVIENDKLIITNKNNISNSLKYLASLVVARTLVSFGRVEGNRTFAKLGYDLKEDIIKTNDFKKSFKEIIIDKLASSTENYRMPSYEESHDIESKRDLYTNLKGNLKSILISIEEHINGGNTIQKDKYNIEHIFPQDPKEWEEYKEESDLKIISSFEDMKSWLNTLGNLSITSCKDNSSLSNKVFKEKKEILESRSYLKINKMIYEYKEWSVNEIKNRANQILEIIDEIWEFKNN